MRHREGAHIDDEVLWRRDGTCFPASQAAVPMIRDGVVVGAVVTFSDITERKEAAEALHRQALVYNSIRDAVLITDDRRSMLSPRAVCPVRSSRNVVTSTSSTSGQFTIPISVEPVTIGIADVRTVRD